MSCEATTYETERFRVAVSRRIGLQFDDAKLGFLGEVLQRRVDKFGLGCAGYLWELECEPSPAEISALAGELTVGETYFFRNHEQFEALAEVALPERMRVQANGRKLRLLSAGCSSGEEPYSMAIVARAVVCDQAREVVIRAVDINPAALEKAKRARYSAWALRETPADVQSKYFHPDGRELVLDDVVRDSVAFATANLADDDPALWQPAAYDVIFCRNVLMYFEPEQMSAVVVRIARSLVPGGFLFLGHAETLRGVSEQFHLRNSHGTFYHQLRAGAERAVPLSPPPPALSAPRPEQSVAWFDAIRQASERVAALLPMEEVPAVPVQRSVPVFDPAPTLELLRQDRFAEALRHLRAGATTAASAPNADALLLEAALLIHSGQLEAAEDAAVHLLATGACRGAAQYVLALCREHAGLADRAAEHHRNAADFDPTFAMPRLHLGLLARRTGDRESARREFAQALVLLEQEDASRLLLFGGGFSRQALMALCESALKDCSERR